MNSEFDVTKTYSVVHGEISSYDTLDSDDNSFYEVFSLVENGVIFLKEHVERLQSSIEQSGVDFKISYDDVFFDLIKLIEANGCYPLNVKYTVNCARNKWIRKVKYIPSTYPDSELRENGVVLKTVDFERKNPSQKVYTNDMKQLRESLQKDDVFDYLLVDKSSRIRECSKSNIFFYKNNRVYTAADSSVLSGVTRKAVLTLIDSKELTLENLKLEDIKEMDGAFITGTSIGVLSVRKIDDVVFDNKKMDFARKLHAKYQKLVHDDLETFEKRKWYLKAVEETIKEVDSDSVGDISMEELRIFIREVDLIGEEAFIKLRNSSVLIVGLGGVGGAAAEAIYRAGVGRIGILDFDVVDTSNINRQLIALTDTVGNLKTDVMEERLSNIHKKAKVIKHNLRLTEENINILDNFDYDYIIDAIDTVSSKISLIKYAKSNDINIISSMGTGGKLNILDFKIDKIKNTKGCPLARVMRKKLLSLGLPDVKVLYSEEKSVSGGRTPSSISFVPSACGMILAGEVVKDIIK